MSEASKLQDEISGTEGPLRTIQERRKGAAEPDDGIKESEKENVKVKEAVNGGYRATGRGGGGDEKEGKEGRSKDSKWSEMGSVESLRCSMADGERQSAAGGIQKSGRFYAAKRTLPRHTTTTHSRRHCSLLGH